MKGPSGIGVGGVVFCALVVAAAACADRRSDIAVIYRGEISTWRPRLRVTLDSGARARVVVPSFPSAVKAEPVATHGALPVNVALLSASGETIARSSTPSLALAPGRSYAVNVAVGTRRPAQTACSGEWSATAVSPPAAESLYVSITTGARGAAAPRCDD